MILYCVLPPFNILYTPKNESYKEPLLKLSHLDYFSH